MDTAVAKHSGPHTVCVVVSLVSDGIYTLNLWIEVRRTAVIVSTQIMKGSEVKYLESDSAYSFHSWAKRLLELARLSWLMTKYPFSRNCVRQKLFKCGVICQPGAHTFKEAVERAAFVLILARVVARGQGNVRKTHRGQTIPGRTCHPVSTGK